MRRVGTAVFVAALVVAAAPPGRAAADPAGWKPVFSAEFTGAALPSQCWAYDGPHAAPPTSYYRPDDVTVGGGMLHLRMERRDFGGRQYTTGGMGCFKVAQLYGRYEFRAKVPPGAGIDSYATLFPSTEGVDGQATFIELLARPGAEKMYLTNEYGPSAAHKIVAGSYSAGFHTYTIEWSPAGERFLLDGVEQFNDPHVSKTPKWIGFAMSSGDGLTGLPDPQTALPAEFLVDWVHVDAYAPGAPATTPRVTASASRPASPSAAPSAAALSTSVAPSGGPAPDAVQRLAASPARSSSSALWWASGGVLLLAAAGVGFAYRRRRS